MRRFLILLVMSAMTLGLASCCTGKGMNGDKGKQPFKYPQRSYTTKSGKYVLLTMINHGSVELSYHGLNIHIDPVQNFYDKKIDYSCFPYADIILVTHEHADHLDKTIIDKLKRSDSSIFLNETAQKQIGKGEVLKNGDVKTVRGVTIEAVPAYNTTPGREKFHPKGNGNGYVVTIDGLRFYISGDTEDIPEMANLKNIDVALLSTNQPYTMTPEQCIKAAKTIHPKVLVPYHLGDTDVEKIKDGLKDTDIKVWDGRF